MSHQVAWATYFSYSRTARACESACASGRVVKTFTYLWKYYLQICCAHTTNDHKLHGLHNYHVHTPRARGERACASARVINWSLIYGRVFFIFAVNILHITNHK
jgi:hypothetical protein